MAGATMYADDVELYVLRCRVDISGTNCDQCLKPVLNQANVCSPEHTSDTSTNYDSFLN